LKGLDHKQKLTSFRTSQVLRHSIDFSWERRFLDWMLCDFNDASFPLPACHQQTVHRGDRPGWSKKNKHLL